MLTEKEAWESTLQELQEGGGGWMCHSIEALLHRGDISFEAFDKMMAKIEAAAYALHLTKSQMNDGGLWGYSSPKRFAWVKKQIKRLEKSENVPV